KIFPRRLNSTGQEAEVVRLFDVLTSRGYVLPAASRGDLNPLHIARAMYTVKALMASGHLVKYYNVPVKRTRTLFLRPHQVQPATIPSINSSRSQTCVRSWRCSLLTLISSTLRT